MVILDGPCWSSPSLFGLYQDKKIRTRKSPKMESSMRLSPRRIKATPTIMLYELRMIGLKTRPSSLLRKLEATIKKWRGLVRWYMQGHTSMRGEVVIHIVGERFGRVNRVDNLVASWRRAIARIRAKKGSSARGARRGATRGGAAGRGAAGSTASRESSRRSSRSAHT